MRELGEVKDALDMEVKQNFIDPLQNLHEKDLKEIQVGEHTHTFHTQTHKKRNNNLSVNQLILVFFCSIT